MPAVPAYLEPNAIIAGKYRVEGIIGKGGMGTVVAAEHTLLKQRVALKFLLEVGKPTVLERFFREARAATRIESEHICRVMDLGTLEDGAPYIVMEMMNGSDLAQHLRERTRLPVAEAADYVLQALDALVEAHARGIVHRDLKPSNLFLARRGDGTEILKVLDFGISKLDGGGELASTTESTDIGPPRDEPASASVHVMTETGSMMGSPPYMSPEQLRSTRDVDARTDVWALGVMLYELVAGERPFRGNDKPTLFHAILTGAYVPLRVRCPDVPHAFEALVDSCLRIDMWSRCPSAIALAEGLAPFVSNGDARMARARRLAGGLQGNVAKVTSQAQAQAQPQAQANEVRAVPPPGIETGGPVVVDRAKNGKTWALPVLAASLALLVAGGGLAFTRQRASSKTTAATTSLSPSAPAPRSGAASAEPPPAPAAPPALLPEASVVTSPTPSATTSATPVAGAGGVGGVGGKSGARPGATARPKAGAAGRPSTGDVDLGRY
jgi:tRNA A-37 threonylcarbamoyl transferase component Bud32